jgi:hypothetical protein
MQPQTNTTDMFPSDPSGPAPQSATGPTITPPLRSESHQHVGRIVVGSLATGLMAALLLAAPFVPAQEDGVTGAVRAPASSGTRRYADHGLTGPHDYRSNRHHAVAGRDGRPLVPPISPRWTMMKEAAGTKV